MIREDILQQFPELFGTKKVKRPRGQRRRDDCDAHTRIASGHRRGPECPSRASRENEAPVRTKYAWPNWDESFEDPLSGKPWTFRNIVQGLIDNFLDRESEWRWRLNDEVPIPADVHPLQNPGLELTGPWHPLDMAFNALNSAAPMNMPDFEDASPAHFQPDGAGGKQPVATFAALQNAQADIRGRMEHQVLRCGKEGQNALVQD